jgi:UDP-2,3-diacylglucosamine hydrolase
MSPFSYSPRMSEAIASFILIAGKGVYPLLLAREARHRGVKRIVVLAFKGETDRSIASLADEIHWIYVGQLQRMLDILKTTGITNAIMAGQITPSNLFTVRLDSAMLGLLSGLKLKNAETIFGAVGARLAEVGIALLPASSFMESFMPAAGVITKRGPTDTENTDITAGFKIANAVSALDIGQTIVMKSGTVIAVEAFEGTNQAILRAGKLAGKGTAVIKVAKHGHDMRFDIPVVGQDTIRTLYKAGASALAVEAGRSIILEKEIVAKMADSANICIVATPPLTQSERT